MTPTSQPLVTIILPVRNEGKYLPRCLEAVFAQDYPAELTEVIVADGMSTDQTQTIIKHFQNLHPNLLLIENPAKIVPPGLNQAICRAKGDIIIRVDGHCVIAPDYVRHCVDHLMHSGVDGVGGSMTTVGEDPLSATIALSMSSSFGVGGASFRTLTGKTMLTDTVPFAAYKMTLIQTVGLYDEELVRNQDDEYNYRIRAAGGKILLASNVHATYYSRGTFARLWKQYFQYGFFKVRVLQKHPRQMRMRQFIPPLFVTALIIAGFAAFNHPRGWLLLALIAGSYLLANVGASALTAARHGWRHLPALPVCFAILHLSYGLGFLAGLIRYAGRWGDQIGRVPDFTLMTKNKIDVSE